MTGTSPGRHLKVTLVAVAVLVVGATVSIATGDGLIPREWGTALIIALIPAATVFALWSRVLGNVRIMEGAVVAGAPEARRRAVIASAFGAVLGLLVIALVYLYAR